jgi:hypothetical protein
MSRILMERHSNHPPLPSEQPAQERQNLPSVSDILAQKAQREERVRGRRKGWAYHRESSRLGNDLVKLYTQNPHLRAVTQSFRQLYAFFPS